LLKFHFDRTSSFFVNPMEKNDVCTSESVDGSRDVWSSKSSDSSSADHLVVMVNGILGRCVCGGILCSILVKCCAVGLILFLCWYIGYCYLIGLLCN
jgi:hypothetical protein